MLTDLELEVLNMLLAGRAPVLRELRAQLANCRVVKREYTGHGFYTTLSMAPEAEPASVTSPRAELEDVHADIDGMANGAGFILYVTDGVLDLLEGFAYAEPWPCSVGSFKLRYTGARAVDVNAISTL